MVKGMRTALLLALTLGMGLSSSAMATRLCTVTLDTCCDATSSPDCASDCCGTDSGGCCLVVLSDEAAMLAPIGVTRAELVIVDLDFAEALPRRPLFLSAQVFDTPDPPPPSTRERLARLESRLI
ncbi:MAG: hypothetical protein P1U81_11360 [Verrucomicrobiales bacterium]|nr:hypothetical protein [Verrucomicrobiales bacterium]